MEHSGEFRPERGVVILYIAVGAVVAGFGVTFAVLTWVHGTHWPLTVLAGCLLLGAWVASRAVVMRIAFDSDAMEIIGLFRSHRIARSDVLAIDPDGLRRPTVRWAPPGSTDRWTLLLPVSMPHPFLPTAMHLRRLRFLARLKRWAPDAQNSDVQRGLQSRMRESIGRATKAVEESPKLLIVLGLVSLGVVVASQLTR